MLLLFSCFPVYTSLTNFPLFLLGFAVGKFELNNQELYTMLVLGQKLYLGENMNPNGN